MHFPINIENSHDCSSHLASCLSAQQICFIIFSEIFIETPTVPPVEAPQSRNVGIIGMSLIGMVGCGLFMLDILTLGKELLMLKNNLSSFSQSIR